MNEIGKSRELSHANDEATHQTISESVDQMRDKLFEINQKIYENPELCYEEIKAHDNIVSLLHSTGIDAKPHVYGIETAFLAEYGSGGRVVTFCAEYDALPGIGHACGHNLIATASLSAFFGLVARLKESKIPGRVRLLGTPAEEGGGGKIKLIEAGAFAGVDAALMCHPIPSLPSLSKGVHGSAYGSCLAVSHFIVNFKGKSAHAAMAPWFGVNALDAVTLAYTAISMLRQQIQPTERINIVTKTDQNAKYNIIVDKAQVECAVRTDTLKQLESLKSRVLKCFEGAAIATGCEVEYDTSSASYAELRSNETLGVEFREGMIKHERNFVFDPNRKPDPYSTDMGNVSYVCPSFHGGFCIPTEAGQSLHNPNFTKAAGAAEACDIAINVGKGMAFAGWKVLAYDEVAQQVKAGFELDRSKRND